VRSGLLAASRRMRHVHPHGSGQRQEAPSHHEGPQLGGGVRSGGLSDTSRDNWPEREGKAVTRLTSLGEINAFAENM
jgi:hypothetical protein